MTHRDAVVVGAGPAGLGAALMLARGGADVTLVDAAASPGGLCVTRRSGGFAYDLGGHIPFVRDDARLAWLRELIGDDLRWVDRPVSCWRDGRIVAGRYLDQRPRRPVALATPDGTAAGELGSRFGARFVDLAMRPYLEKIDGLPLERIPADRARRLLEDQAAPDGFHFPEGGIGRLMDAMAAAAAAAGAEVLLSTPVEAIEVPRGAVEAVRLGGDGGRRIATRNAVVAMPAGAAARLLAPAAPGSLTRGVPMRAVCIVILAVDRERISDEPWIQVDLPDVPFSRAFEPGNWSPRMRPDGATAIGLECYCAATPDDPVWRLADADLAAACARALHAPLGLLADPGAARLVEVVRLPRAYPAPDLAHMDAIRAPADWLRALDGVHLAPGAAVIEAVEGGERAAAAVLSGRASPAVDDGPPAII
ncbi:MAG TPA: FAD-dependent oxidoreductase [Miltoncostaeaceae bacterium]|jgi:protoporphyrinogen oxidase|nr:FAD-dependent oxidoreductase [Miltoncostaeaceae bacterium]